MISWRKPYLQGHPTGSGQYGVTSERAEAPTVPTSSIMVMRTYTHLFPSKRDLRTHNTHIPPPVYLMNISLL
jgi:hypothetical protein